MHNVKWFNRNEWVDTSAFNSCDLCVTCNTPQVSCRFLLIHQLTLILSKSSSFNTSTKFQRSNYRELAATVANRDRWRRSGENVAISDFFTGFEKIKKNPLKTVYKNNPQFPEFLLWYWFIPEFKLNSWNPGIPGNYLRIPWYPGIPNSTRNSRIYVASQPGTLLCLAAASGKLIKK